jgi:hypothetical protein
VALIPANPGRSGKGNQTHPQKKNPSRSELFGKVIPLSRQIRLPLRERKDLIKKVIRDGVSIIPVFCTPGPL